MTELSKAAGDLLEAILDNLEGESPKQFIIYRSIQDEVETLRGELRIAREREAREDAEAGD